MLRSTYFAQNYAGIICQGLAGRPHCLALSSIASCEDSAVTVLNSLSNTVLRQVPVSKTLILDGMSSFSMSLKEVLLWMILLPVAAHD